VLVSEAKLQDWAPQMLSVLRIAAALLFLQYGLSKYFGYPAKPPANFSMLLLLGLAGAVELVGSLLLLVGLWSRWAAFIMSGEIAVAYFMRRAPNGFFPAGQWRRAGGIVLLRLSVSVLRRAGAVVRR
jgi:putative oxidoreductase